MNAAARKIRIDVFGSSFMTHTPFRRSGFGGDAGADRFHQGVHRFATTSASVPVRARYRPS